MDNDRSLPFEFPVSGTPLKADRTSRSKNADVSEVLGRKPRIQAQHHIADNAHWRHHGKFRIHCYNFMAVFNIF
ncbi:hypothetical protein AU14_03645 [Marinobacter similis]|uniref:Uncharacterized protein n=1 Tax=Marinobacter similis TaxID=1420916 RepID=W5YM73_9GAMM|nr:hypothetical protein AU14_03645 [Marinobacter similis]